MDTEVVDMNPGKRRHRITIQAPTKTSDGMGGSTVAWTDIATVWGSIAGLNYRESERMQAMKLQSEVSSKITIPYRAVIRNEWRLKMGNRYFDILYRENVKEVNAEIALFVREVQ